MKHEKNLTSFGRLLHMWLNVVATRHDSGEGKLISPAQAWDNPHRKFPDEFLVFSDAIEAQIAFVEDEDEDNDLQCDATDYSSSDDEFEREMVRRMHASPQNNSSSASCTA